MSVDSKITTQDEDKIKLSVVINDEEFDREVGEALKRISKNIKLPGFTFICRQSQFGKIHCHDKVSAQITLKVRY